MASTFLGGIRIEENKLTKDKKIENMLGQKYVYIPLHSSRAQVKAGDYVRIGDVISKCGEALPVHASVSGMVLKTEEKSYFGAEKEKFVIIENDGKYELSENVKPLAKKVTELTSDEIIDIVKNAGISSSDGYTYEKLLQSREKANHLIINCAESEPYLTAKHRLILEEAEKIIYGAKIILLCLGIKRATFATEENKRDAAKELSKHLGKSDIFDVQILKTKYPQSDTNQIVFSLTGKEIPHGKRPADIGCTVFDAEECYAIFDAVIRGVPLVSKVVTVSGECIREPKNLRLPIGTSIEDAIFFCGGFSKEPAKVISGGALKGKALWDICTPVTKDTSAILALSETDSEKNFACIRCGRCADVCPMHLLPLYLASFCEKNALEKCEEFNISSCTECGCCAYICPGKVPIVDYIRSAKEKLKQKNTK